MEIYHGNNVIVENPVLLIQGFYKDFVKGNITREAFWELVKFKEPTHQILFATEKAPKYIKFIRSYEL